MSDAHQEEFDLQSAIAYWQKILRLTEYDIEASLVKPTDFDEPHSNMGDSRYQDTHYIAQIKILDPEADHKPADRIKHDPEHTLIHEMLHIGLREIDRLRYQAVQQMSPALARMWGDMFIDAEERLINRICDALLTLKRGYKAR